MVVSVGKDWTGGTICERLLRVCDSGRKVE